MACTLFLNICLLAGLSVLVSTERKEGDFIIGAVLPIQSGTNDGCNSTNYEGLAVSEAIRFAISEINNDHKLLGSLTIEKKLGYDIQDTCGSTEKEKDIIYAYNGARRTYKEKSGQPKPVSVVIGEFRGPSAGAMKLLNFEKIPQLSYAHGNANLKPDGLDPEEVANLISVYPEDASKLKAITSMLDKMKIEYTTLIAKKTARGKTGLKLMQESYAKSKMCLSDNELATKASDIKKMVQDLSKKAKATICVLHCEMADMLIALEEAERLNLTNIIWISTNSLNKKMTELRSYVEQVEGMVFLESHVPDPQGFKKSLEQKGNTFYGESNWLQQAMKENGASDDCMKQGGAKDRKAQDACKQVRVKVNNEILKFGTAASYAIDAVYTIANGIQSMLQSKKAISLFNAMKMLDFESPVTKSKVYFNAHGQTYGQSYLLYNVIGNTTSTMKTVEVGKWKRDLEPQLTFTMDKMRFKDGTATVPKSKCSNDCVPGKEIIYPKVGPKCCWSCVKCPNLTFSNTTNSKCFKCLEMKTPNPEQTNCREFEQLHMKVKHVVSEIALFLLTIGLLLTFFAMFIFNQNKDCEVMQMANNQTMQSICLGLIIVFVSSIIMMFKPSFPVCIAYAAVFNTGLTIVWGALITKTWLFRRIFYGSNGEPNSCGNKPGLSIGFFLLLIELGIMAIGFYLERVTILYDDTEKWSMKYIECSYFRGMAFWLSYGYVVLLSVLVNFFNCGVPNVEARFGEYNWLCLTSCSFYGISFLYIASLWAFKLLHRIEVGIILTILHSYVIFFAYLYPKLHMVLFMHREKMSEIAKSEKAPLMYRSGGDDYDDDEEAPNSPVSGIDVFKNRILQLEKSPSEADDKASSKGGKSVSN